MAPLIDEYLALWPTVVSADLMCYLKVLACLPDHLAATAAAIGRTEDSHHVAAHS
jgi:outer membrane protein assembly factor BamD (BamD/ComL family)